MAAWYDAFGTGDREDDGGVDYSLACGYDERFARFSPGNLLLEAVLRCLCDEGLRGMDMLEGTPGYKERWTPHAARRHRVQVFPRTPAGAAEWAAWAHGRPLAKGLRSSLVHAGLSARRGARGRA